MKRVFFAFEVFSPWPKSLPRGRVLAPSARHLTLVFLGSVNFLELNRILPTFPLPSLKVGLVAKFDKIKFLPPKRPNVISWHVDWLDDPFDFNAYQKEIAEWLERSNFTVRLHKSGFLPHVTLARRPFSYHEWREAFEPLPLYIKNIHLYESLGNLEYQPLWSHELLAPFEQCSKGDQVEILVRGESLERLFNNALIAIAFQHPKLLKQISKHQKSKEHPLTPQTLIDTVQKVGASPTQTLREPAQGLDGVWSWEIKISLNAF